MVKSFAVALMNRFEKLGSMKDLVATLRYNAEAVKITPPGHPEYSERLQHFAASFAKRFMQLGDQQDLVCAHFLYNLSSAYKPSDPEFSWHSALSWADLAKRFQPEYCLRAFSVAFNLLPEVLWVGHSIPVRHDAVHRVGVGSATSNAVNTCLGLKNPTAAVEFMEQGLATVFQQMLQLKTNVDQLPAVQAKEFQTMSSQLYTRAFADLLELVVDRNNLLAEIRKQPDAESFLLPKSYKDLRNASQAGPVVILNAHEDACHAIIILTPSSEPVYFAINVTVEQLEGQKTFMKKLLRRCHVRSGRDSGTSRLFGHMEEFSVKGTQECFTDLLTWIWTRIVQPVYQALESHGISKGRLWWLPTGAFTSLPLHACPPTDHFVHSYTATLGSLIEARARKPSNMKSEVGIVGVSYTDSSGANYLRGVQPEVSNILTAIPKSLVKALENQSATPQAVKTQLQDCSWLHLACHGKQDLSQPTKSHLLLYEGKLELETILKMPLNNAEVVFLAACQTAMGDSQLVNESFHLGGGLITAGFRGAIGTTWAMNDQDGPIVAKTFYSHLFRDGRQPEATDAAEALHLAVKELRDNNVSYERWIPFIHMGV
ncbi:CHAT domain-containing protein [Mycena pura]|uniref:CHAT domain-containing protein n=1 Tax=Mycena pura TaxID=153505 RepID=A0AAD6Y4T8_9AGAR|nr:CHAT domain-containing protein [Mycena pura]